MSAASAGPAALPGEEDSAGPTRDGLVAPNDAAGGSLTLDLEARIAELDAIAWNLPGPRAAGTGSAGGELPGAD